MCFLMKKALGKKKSREKDRDYPLFRFRPIWTEKSRELLPNSLSLASLLQSPAVTRCFQTISPLLLASLLRLPHLPPLAASLLLHLPTFYISLTISPLSLVSLLRLPHLPPLAASLLNQSRRCSGCLTAIISAASAIAPTIGARVEEIIIAIDRLVIATLLLLLLGGDEGERYSWHTKLDSRLARGWKGAREADALYVELWRACARPLVEVSKTGEKVYYFSQGHMEQLEASTNQELNEQIPLFNLPPKILYSVVNVRLKADPETDEVFAQIVLLPQPDQHESTITNACPMEQPRPKVYSFYKILIASDTSTHGGFSVLRRHATECLLHLTCHSRLRLKNLWLKISITLNGDSSSS